MKKPTLLIILFFCIVSYSQIKTGTIQYKVSLNKEIPLTINSVQNDLILKMDKEAEKISYTLIFCQDESYFYANPRLVEISNFSFLAGTYNFGKIKYYQNKTKQEYREYVDSKRLGVQILNKKVFYEWSLSQEYKMIDGYKCYKATSPSISSTGEKSENSKFNIAAWYCPELPIQEGPVGYGGLPGLILELQLYKSTFTAFTIDLNPKTLPEIDKLTSQKAISEETYKEMYMGTLNKEKYNAFKESEVNQKK